MAPPFLFSGLSVLRCCCFRLSESTSDECFQLVHVRPVLRMMAASAPEAIALFCARKPASRPITRQNAVMREGLPYPDFVHTFTMVLGRIISGKIGAVQIIVNGAGTHLCIILLRKIRAPVRTVSTDNYQCIDVLFLYDLISFLASFGSDEVSGGLFSVWYLPSG